MDDRASQTLNRGGQSVSGQSTRPGPTGIAPLGNVVSATDTSPVYNPSSTVSSTAVSPKSTPSNSMNRDNGKGRFKLDPYSLLLPHERKMYQQSGTSSTGSASPRSDGSPVGNALKLGQFGQSQGQGQGYTGQPQQRIQEGMGQMTGFGPAGAALEADKGEHFYAGQGHEQWQSAVLQGGQQAKGTRLVSSMGEQGSHNRQGTSFFFCNLQALTRSGTTKRQIIPTSSPTASCPALSTRIRLFRLFSQMGHDIRRVHIRLCPP